jgi:enoyl-CoA hydratase/carnithine racemase
MSFKTEIQDNIAIFTIDNAPSNSITTEALKALGELVDRVNGEKALKGLILTGTPMAFCGGYDLVTFTTFSGPDAIVKWFKQDEEILYKLFTCSKPVVAAITGHATAAGMILVQACDYRIIKNNPKVRVGMTEIKLGMALTPMQGEIMIYGLDSLKNWNDVMYKGQLIPAPDAVATGVIDELADEAELLAKAKAKVCEWIDTPNRPFIKLKASRRRQAARNAREAINAYEYKDEIAAFTNPALIAGLKKTLEIILSKSKS